MLITYRVLNQLLYVIIPDGEKRMWTLDWRLNMPVQLYYNFIFSLNTNLSVSARTVSEEFSSSGDSKTEEEQEKRSPKEKEGKDKDKERDEGKRTPGPRLNIKTVLSTYGDFHVKDKTAVRTSYL